MRNINPSEIFSLQLLLCKIVMDEQFKIFWWIIGQFQTS